jgi:PadR family transcriptional regulator, regulatory protein PadR
MCSEDDDHRGHGHNHAGSWRDRVQEDLGHEPGDHGVFGGRRFAAWWGPVGARRVNPLVALFLSRGGGLLPLLVLHFLSRSPRYGNDIMRELEQFTGGAWVSNPGAIYPLLRWMEHRGLVTGEWEDPDRRTRRIYTLTESGHREYARARELMKPGFREALGVIQSVYEALFQPSGTLNGHSS